MAVAFSVNPANILDVLALLLRRKKQRKEKVVEYVESIAADAASLAGVWQRIFDELAAGRTEVDTDENKQSTMRSGSTRSQTRLTTRG